MITKAKKIEFLSCYLWFCGNSPNSICHGLTSYSTYPKSFQSDDLRQSLDPSPQKFSWTPVLDVMLQFRLCSRGSSTRRRQESRYSFDFPWEDEREYWMFYRGLDFLAVLWFGSSLSPTGRGGQRSQFIRRRESMLLYESFNTLWVTLQRIRAGRSQFICKFFDGLTFFY